LIVSLINNLSIDAMFDEHKWQVTGPDLPIGYIGLSLGPQDLRGTPTNCGTHKVNGGYMII